VKDITLNEGALLVSFDVTALYPNVPIPAAMKLLNGWLKSIGLEKHKVAMCSELAQLCMSENCFQFEEKFYRHKLEHQSEMPCRHLLQTSSWGFLRKS
jgi:hypothetical protein